VRKLAVAAMLASCHLVTETSSLRPGAHHHDVDRLAATVRPPTLIVDDDAALRFVEPLDCPGLDVVDQDEVITRSTRANVATAVIGILVTAAGGVATALGGLSGDTAVAIGGLVGVVAGLPLAVGPWLGDGDVDRLGTPHPPLRHVTTSEPCGTRALAASSATLDAVGVEVAGAIDSTGAFSVSPFLLVDAFDPRSAGAWDLRAIAQTGSGDKTFHVVIPADALVRGARAFLAGKLDFDAQVQALQVVPDLSAATPPQIILAQTADGPVAKVTVAISNAGPGDTWQLRGQLETAVRALDGRILYFGHVARGQTSTRELVIPLTASSASALRYATIDLAIQLHDAHGTAPSAPIKFHGMLAQEKP
jgi:hypothetical protein